MDPSQGPDIELLLSGKIHIRTECIPGEGFLINCSCCFKLRPSLELGFG